MSNIVVIMENSPGIKTTKLHFTSQISINLASGLHQTNSFRILELEKQNLRNCPGKIPHLIDGEIVLKPCTKAKF